MGIHGGHGETSLMLHLRPELVHMELARAPRAGGAARRTSRSASASRSSFGWLSDDFGPDGHIGDPTGATAEDGKELFEAGVGTLAEVIVEASRFTPSAPQDAADHRGSLGRPPIDGPEDTLDASGCVVTPGLVNAHHHLLQTAFRTLPGTRGVPMRDGCPDGRRLRRASASTPSWRDAAAAAGLAEALLCGVTTVADHHLTWPAALGTGGDGGRSPGRPPGGRRAGRPAGLRPR